MNAENFAEFLKNPSFLYQISYQELKSLVLQYPFSQNLQILLLLKSRIESDKDFKRHLSKAATYSIDRHHLFRILREKAPDQPEIDTYLLTEEFLELKNLNELEKNLEQFQFNGLEDSRTEEEKALAASINNEIRKNQSPVVSAKIDEPELESFESASLTGVMLEDLLSKASPSSPLPELPQEEPFPIEAESSLDDTSESNESSNGISVATELENAEAIENNAYSFNEENKGELTSSASKLLEKKKEQEIIDNPVSSIKPSKAVSSVLNRPNAPKLKAEEQMSAPIRPIPKSSFSSYKDQPISSIFKKRANQSASSKKEPSAPKLGKKLKKSKHSSLNDPAKSPFVPTKEQEDEVVNIVQESLQEKDGLISETLAQLLEQQGKYAKAIQMYQRLSLIFPQKSTFFAAKIEKLTKKL